METFQSIVPAFVEMLQKAIGHKSTLEYFNSYREYTSTASPLKKLLKNEKGEFVELASGDLIPLDQIITLNGVFFPNYEEYTEVLGMRCSR
ncbi:MAG: hypothetical protein QM669_06145 [Siphonobacter sp.]